MTALQDWLSIRPFDPVNHVKSLISSLRGGDSSSDAETPGEPALMRSGVERC